MVPGDIEPRLRALGLSTTDRLSDAQARWFSEFVDVGEYGLALECLADWLSDELLPVSAAERSEAESLATLMCNVDQVMEPLQRCPPMSA